MIQENPYTPQEPEQEPFDKTQGEPEPYSLHREEPAPAPEPMPAPTPESQPMSEPQLAQEPADVTQPDMPPADQQFPSGQAIPLPAAYQPPKEPAKPPTKNSPPEAVFYIEVDSIKANPLQPRRHFGDESLKELAASIREFGILQPLVVSKVEHDVETGTRVEYQLIAGERRLRAAQLLGWERVPAIIRNVGRNIERLELAVVENLQRENLNPIETARAYAKLQDEFGMTQREIAARLGKSRETVANALRLLQLPSELQDAVAHGQINESQGRLLLTIENPAQQQALYKELLGRTMSVRELKNRIKRGGNVSEPSVPAKHLDPEVQALQEKLSEYFGAKVRLEAGNEGGKLIISFFSSEELRGILEKMKLRDEG